MSPHPSFSRICIAYSRVSSDDQARDGLSLDAQADRLRAYAVAQGLGSVELQVEARSAKSIARRPVLQAILDDVRGGRVSALLVFKLDRLARNTIEALDLARVLREHDCRLVSLSETLDTGSAFGTFFYTVLAALAQMERDQIAERTRVVLDHMRRQGARLGRAPTGWRKVRGTGGRQDHGPGARPAGPGDPAPHPGAAVVGLLPAGRRRLPERRRGASAAGSVLVQEHGGRDLGASGASGRRPSSGRSPGGVTTVAGGRPRRPQADRAAK